MKQRPTLSPQHQQLVKRAETVLRRDLGRSRALDRSRAQRPPHRHGRPRGR